MVSLDPLVREILIAALAVSALIALISVIYSAVYGPLSVAFRHPVGNSGFAPGVAILSMASPRHRADRRGHR